MVTYAKAEEKLREDRAPTFPFTNEQRCTSRYRPALRRAWDVPISSSGLLLSCEWDRDWGPGRPEVCGYTLTSLLGCYKKFLFVRIV